MPQMRALTSTNEYYLARKKLHGAADAREKPIYNKSAVASPRDRDGLIKKIKSSGTHPN